MKKIILLLFLFLFLGGGLYIYWYYFNVYSYGTRNGIIQKLSRKGNIFKTYEGEILMSGFGQKNGGFQAQYFYFSIEDPEVANQLEKSIGKDVEVHYIQYRRSLPWRGESYNGKNEENGQYIVDKVLSVNEGYADPNSFPPNQYRNRAYPQQQPVY